MNNIGKCMGIRRCLIANRLSLILVLGVVTGIIGGTLLQVMAVRLTPIQTSFVRFPGELFLQMMQIVLIPLVVSSLLTATAEIEVKKTGKAGLRATVYYITTLAIASLIGVCMVLTIQPGKRGAATKYDTVSTKQLPGSPLFAFMDLIRNSLPGNLIEACISSKATREVFIGDKRANTTGLGEDNNTDTDFNNVSDYRGERHLVVETVSGVNMIGLVSVSIFCGSIISSLGEPAKPVYHFFKALRIITFQMVSVFMWYAPIGIGFLIVASLAGVDDLGDSWLSLIIFTVTVIAGLVLHGFLVLPIIYLLIVRRNPLTFIRNVIPALLLAFGSESSGVTLPLTIKCLEEKNHLDPRITRLLTSLGATINMDGICLYFSMMTIFLAQLNDITMGPGQIITSCLLAISVAVGVGCVPGAQLVYLTAVPAALQLPTQQIGMLLAVDWLLSRCRTVVNVLGDCFGAGIVNALTVDELDVAERSRPNTDYQICIDVDDEKL